MDVDGEAGMNGNGDSKGKGKRKYYVGEDGVGIWRPGMEVGNFVSDGVGMYLSLAGVAYCHEGVQADK
jgi:actin-like protein 6A